MMRVILGSFKVDLMPMGFWGWAQVRSFNCDMYSRNLNMCWESSGFGLGGFNIGGAVINGGGDYICIYIYIHICICMVIL